MFNARNFIPLPPAVAAGTVVRAGGRLNCRGNLDMADTTVSFPIHRGVMR
jgi:hypothetical protein